MTDKVFYTYEDLRHDITGIIRQIEQTGWRPDLIIGVARGGLIPANYLSQWFDIPLHSYHYSLRDHKRTDVFDTKLINDVAHKKVLVVDDICDTGKTMNAIVDSIQHQHTACSAKFACLHHNLGQSIIEPEFCGREINKAEKDVWICYPWEEWWCF